MGKIEKEELCTYNLVKPQLLVMGLKEVKEKNQKTHRTGLFWGTRGKPTAEKGQVSMKSQSKERPQRTHLRGVLGVKDKG